MGEDIDKSIKQVGGNIITLKFFLPPLTKIDVAAVFCFWLLKQPGENFNRKCTAFFLMIKKAALQIQT